MNSVPFKGGCGTRPPAEHAHRGARLKGKGREHGAGSASASPELLRRELAFCLLVLWVFVGAAGFSRETDLVTDVWQTEAGLPHNAVTAVVQTQDGYLWVGTSNGLARFDGVRFSTFRAVDHPGLVSNRILCLYEDREGILWIGTADGGLVRYEKGRFTSFSTREGLSSDTILCVGKGREGELWVGTDSGLNRLREGQREGFFQSEALPDEPVYAVCRPERSPMLFATRKGLYQLRQERVVPYEAPGFEAMRGAVFYCLYEDEERRLWAGGYPGLLRLESSGAASIVPSAEIGGAAIRALKRATDGRIWFATSTGELYEAAPKTGPLEVSRILAFPSAATALCEDYEGNLWVGTVGHGLYRLKRRQLRWAPFGEGFSEGGAVPIFETSSGELWLVAKDHGLYRYEDRGFQLVERLPLPEGVVVQTACATGADTIWLGTRSDGLLQYAQGVVHQFSERNGLSDSQISVLCAGAQGGLWIGTRNGGLNHLQGRHVTRYNTPWGFRGAFACALEPGPGGSLWIGTTGDGLFHLVNGRWTSYTPDQGLPSGYVGALHADVEDTLWIGTAGGLCRLWQGRITVFPGPNRLVEEAVVQLRGDADGNLWVGSSSGIYRYRKDQLNAFADGRVSFLDVTPFGKEDGLPALQCLPQPQSRSSPSPAGAVWFATSKGLVFRDPAAVQLNTAPPPVVLEAVLIENEPVPFDDVVCVPPGKENLQFQFTALSLTAPGKVAFRYQLEGFDRGWSEVTPSRAARYPKVGPGQYRFHVVARNNDGVWNETGAGVALVVTPFWWATYTFRITAAAAVVLALGGLYRLRQNRRRELERLRVRIASDLHDDIGSSLWSITLLSRMLAQHGTLSPEERQDINEIHRISVQTSNAIRDIIWLINPGLDSLQDLLLRMKDFAGVMLRGIEFRLECKGVDPARRLSLDFRQHLFFLFKEALTNVAKHAQATVVEARFEQQAGGWRFLVRDNGVGFVPAAATTGNGLKNLRARAAKLGATLEIHSRPGEGTTLILTTDKL